MNKLYNNQKITKFVQTFLLFCETAVCRKVASDDFLLSLADLTRSLCDLAGFNELFLGRSFTFGSSTESVWKKTYMSVFVVRTIEHSNTQSFFQI